MKTEKTLSQSLQVNSTSDLNEIYLLVKIRAIFLLVIICTITGSQHFTAETGDRSFYICINGEEHGELW